MTNYIINIQTFARLWDYFYYPQTRGFSEISTSFLNIHGPKDHRKLEDSQAGESVPGLSDPYVP